MAAPKALILGVSGQDGAYLAQFLIGKGYEVHGTTRQGGGAALSRMERLGISSQVQVHSLSPTDALFLTALLEDIRPAEVYNLAGQTSVAASFEQPVETFESNALATVTLLEALRRHGKGIRLFNAASSECFGDCPEPATEATAFHPRSPYAVAKAAGFWAVLNYRQAYGMPVSSGILFNHESPLRPERFVTQKIVSAALRISRGADEVLCLGDLSIERDWGWAPDYVEVMWRMLQMETPDDLVIATGQSHSLADFVAAVFAALDLDWCDHVRSDKGLLRPSDISRSAANPEKARRLLGWSARTLLPEVAARLVAAKRDNSAPLR